jgi:hypothetical protein
VFSQLRTGAWCWQPGRGKPRAAQCALETLWRACWYAPAIGLIVQEVDALPRSGEQAQRHESWDSRTEVRDESSKQIHHRESGTASTTF